MAVHVHPTAIVDSRARLADGVHIGPYCVIDGDVEIGAQTRLISHVSIMGHVELGEKNTLYPFCVIGAEPQDLSYKGSPTRVEIGDHNILREAVTIHRATEKEDGVTRLGSHNYIMAGSHVAHDVQLGSHVMIANDTMLSGHVHVHDYATLSGMIGVHHFASIGSYCFIGGMSRISMDVPPYMLVEGNPAVVRCVNMVGLKRRGFSAAEIKSLTEAHRLLYRVRMPVEQAKEVLLSHDNWTAPVSQLFEFLAGQRTGRHGRGRERVRKAA